jgi:hypothetical protein
MNANFYISDYKKDRHYEISFHMDRLKNHIWIANAGHEGMEVSEQQFFELIDKFFKENF